MRALGMLAFLAGASVAVSGQAPPPAAGPQFEVISARLGNPNTAVPPVPIPRLDHRRLAFSGTLFAMVLAAYDVNGCGPFRISCRLLSGGPAWIQKDRFDIQAKAPENSPDYTLSQLLDGQAPQFQLMLRALLAE